MEQYEWTQGGADSHQPDLSVGGGATLPPEDCPGQAPAYGPGLSRHHTKG